MLQVAEDGVEAFALLGAVARDQVGEARVLLVVQVAAEDLEVFGERWLRPLAEVYLGSLKLHAVSLELAAWSLRLEAGTPKHFPESQ